jgi:hypothetical protein
MRDDGTHRLPRLQTDQPLAVSGCATVAVGEQIGAEIAKGKVPAFRGDGVWLTNIPAGAIVPKQPSAVPVGVVRIPAGASEMGDQSGDGLSNTESVNVKLSEFHMNVTEVPLCQRLSAADRAEWGKSGPPRLDRATFSVGAYHFSAAVGVVVPGTPVVPRANTTLRPLPRTTSVFALCGVGAVSSSRYQSGDNGPQL